MPKDETATAVSANTPGAAKHIIQSVIFIVAAKIDSKKPTNGLLISPTFASAIENITAKTIIGTISPLAIEARGFFGINPKKILSRLPFCASIVAAT